MTDAPRARRMRRRSVDDSRMTLVEHLAELRSRLVKSLAALAVGVGIAFVLYPQIFEILQRPYCSLPEAYRFDSGNGDCRLYYFDVLGGFMVRLQLALVVGALIASPVWLYQVAAFISPGLHKHERRWAFGFVVASVLLFAVGGLFAYLTLPTGLKFLVQFSGEELVPLLGAKQYLSFLTLMLVAFGVSFEFPVLLVFLVVVGVVDAPKLRRARRVVYFGVAVLAAVITPSQDPFTFLAMWAPMVLFYEVSVVFARVWGRRKALRAASEGTGAWDDDTASDVAPATPIDADA